MLQRLSGKFGDPSFGALLTLLLSRPLLGEGLDLVPFELLLLLFDEAHDLGVIVD